MRTALWMGMVLLMGWSGWAAAGEARFAVFADPHYYDITLGDQGPAFESYLAGDRKLLRESSAILDVAIDAILARHDERSIDFVLVPGDLTKDGERICHEQFAAAIARLEDAGVPVFVVPGNHDINNPAAVAFVGETTSPVPTVTPEEFAGLYAPFGYGEAFDRDPASLSYVVEPVEGVWVVGMDSALYDHNIDHATTGGAFSDETLAWILNTTAEGVRQGNTVLGFMHHGILEHYEGQSLLYADYLLADWETVSQQLATAGMHLVFTGHYHAQDVVRADWDDTVLYDVETGSLVTYPNPIRFVTLAERSATIESSFISELPALGLDGPFAEHARSYLETGLLGLARLLVQAPIEAGGFGLTPQQADIFAPHAAAAFMAHYAGDEQFDPATQLIVGAYMISPQANVRQLGLALGSLWTDLPPSDTEPVLTW